MEIAPVIKRSEDIPESLVHVEQLPSAAGIKESREPAKQEKPAETKNELNAEDLKEITDKMNQVASVFNTSLAFAVDDPTGKTVIKVMDKITEEVIRQIPPENALKLMANMRDVMGMFLDVQI